MVSGNVLYIFVQGFRFLNEENPPPRKFSMSVFTQNRSGEHQEHFERASNIFATNGVRRMFRQVAKIKTAHKYKTENSARSSKYRTS